MKTLNELIQEAIERFEKLSALDIDKGGWNIPYEGLYEPKVKDFLKTELTNIVKESFKNTEELPLNPLFWKNTSGGIGKYKEGWDEALSDKHNKENQFLNN